jgi:hypothetical protein
MTDVTLVSNGTLTQKITLQNLKDVLVPRASATTAGTIKIGTGLNISDDGVVSVADYRSFTLPRATQTTLGGVKIGSGISVDSTGLISVSYSPDHASKLSHGIVRVGDGINVIDGVISISPTEMSGRFGDSGINIGEMVSGSFKIVNNSYPAISADNSGVLELSIQVDQINNITDNIKLLSPAISYQKGNVNNMSLVTESTASLGLPNYPWDAVYARTLHGNINGTSTNANKLLYDGQYISASASADPNTVLVRDQVGMVSADVFNGIATKAAKLKVDNTYYQADILPNPDTVAVRDFQGYIKANRFTGICDNSDKLNLNSTYAVASTYPTANTIAGRDNDGNISANLFNGTATTARYADLAEKYISDMVYDVGTVVIFGGSHEITTSNSLSDSRVAGVISDRPAYLMNVDSDGQPVALRGKVPVKVVGLVKKGDLLVTSAIPGYAISVGNDKSHGPAIFAKSIEDKTIHDRGTVIAVIL